MIKIAIFFKTYYIVLLVNKYFEYLGQLWHFIGIYFSLITKSKCNIYRKMSDQLIYYYVGMDQFFFVV